MAPGLAGTTRDRTNVMTVISSRISSVQASRRNTYPSMVAPTPGGSSRLLCLVGLDADCLEVHRPAIVGRLHDIAIDIVGHRHQGLGAAAPDARSLVSDQVLHIVEQRVALG